MRYKRTNRFKILFALIVVALGVAAFFIVRTFTQSTQALSAEPKIMPALASQDILPIGDGFIYSDGAYIYFFNKDGDRVWSYFPDMVNFKFAVSDKRVALYSGAQLQLLDASGALTYKGTVNEPIQDVRCGFEQVALQLGEASEKISVLDKDGNPIDVITLSNMSLMDFGFYSPADMLWVLSLDVSGTVPISHVNTYQPGKIMTGGFTVSDELIYRIIFSKNELTVVGTHQATAYAYSGAMERLRSQLIYGWQLMDYAEQKNLLTLAMARTSQAVDGKIQDVKLLFADGTYADVRMPLSCFDLVTGDKLYGVSATTIYAFSYAGERLGAFLTPFPFENIVARLKNNRILVSRGDTVYLIALP